MSSARSTRSSAPADTIPSVLVTEVGEFLGLLRTFKHALPRWWQPAEAEQFLRTFEELLVRPFLYFVPDAADYIDAGDVCRAAQ